MLIVAIFQDQNVIWYDYLGIVPSLGKSRRKVDKRLKHFCGEALLFVNRNPTMKYLKKISLRFIREEDGPTAVEYAIMLALIVLVCIASISVLGQTMKGTFEFISEAF